MVFKAKYFKITGIIFLIFAVIQVLYVFSLPKIINLQSKIPKIEKFFNSKTGLFLKIENADLRTYPDFSFSLKADEFLILDTNKNIIMQADKSLVKIQPLALFLNKFKFQEIKTTNLILNITRFSDNTFGANSFLYRKTNFAIDFNNADITLNSYKIYLEDKYLKRKVFLDGSTFEVKPLTKTLSELKTDGRLNIDGQISSFDINAAGNFFISKKFDLQNYYASGKITNIDLKSVSQYFIKTNQKIDASGKINIYFNSEKESKNHNITEITIKSENISINKNDFEKKFILNGDAEFITRISADKKTLKIEESTLKADNIFIKTKGSIENYNKEKPVINFDVKIFPSKAENIIDILPYGICKEINLIKKYGASADITGSFQIIGNLSKPKLYGSVKAENMHALRGLEKTHNTLIDIKFEDTVVYSDVYVKTKNNQFFKLKGKSYIYDEDWNIFDISTSENIDMGLVCAILVPVSEIFDFPVGPVPQLTVKGGTGSASMHIKGKRLKKEDTRIDGLIKIKNGCTFLAGIDALITDLNLDLKFVQEKIIFSSKSAKVNGFPISINGESDVFGRIEFLTSLNSFNADVLHKIINKSPLLLDAKYAMNSIENIHGNIDAKVSLYGIINPESKDFKNEIKKLNINGQVFLKNNTIFLKGYENPLLKVLGKIDFTNESSEGKNLKVFIGKSEFYTDIKSSINKNNNNTNTEINLRGSNINTKDIIKFESSPDLEIKEFLNIDNFTENNIINSLNLKCGLINEKPDLKTLRADIYFSPHGLINISNGNININNLDLSKKGMNINVNGQIKNFYSKNPVYNLYVKGANLPVKQIIFWTSFLSPSVKTIINSYKEYDGTINFNLNLNPKGILGFVKINKFKIKNIKSDIPFYFEELPINFTNNKISIEKINGYAGRTNKAPVFFNLNIENYMKIPIIKGSGTVKITPSFIERYINTKLSHPIKITGDITLNAELNGSIDSLKIFPVLKLDKESDISYLSVNLGDSSFVREINGEITIRPKEAVINKIEYTKYVPDIDNKIKNVLMWNIKGKINKNNCILSEMTITTFQKLPAKLLNFIFKKSLIKSGYFDCNLTYKNINNIPKIYGMANLENASIPLYNSVIKNGKITANNDKIFISANGKTENTNYFIKTSINNSLILPFKVKTLDIKTKYLDLDRLTDVFNKWSIDAYMNTSLQTAVNFDISDFIIEKGILNAEMIAYKTCPMKNFAADFSLDKNSLLQFSAKDFEMTGGNVSGTIVYDFKSGTIKSHLKVKGIDSNSAAESFFGLKNQITGKLDGNVYLSTFGANDIERLKNLNGKIGFHMEDGTIPKLGSVEYLLRASNLLQSALTALSVNSIIELLKPFKTGSFSKISGCLYVKEGTLKDIAVFSQGQNLSIYLTGDYNIGESEADVAVYGKLGKKTQGLLGPIGNLSANTIFSIIPYSKDNSEFEKELKKIPDIDYNNEDVKFFKSTVKGNINDDDIITSFKWIK